MIQYTRNDIKVLINIMDKEDSKKGKSKAKATSIIEICNKTGLSYSSVRKSLNKFLKDNLVEYGIADGRTKTYHITLKGLEKLSEIRVSIEEEIENE